MPFTQIGLSDPLVKGILATGYKAPTEIQAKAIPAAVAGRDIIGCAQTGTGKTAAFVLPMLDKLSSENSGNAAKKRNPRCLILTPTRELAIQIETAVNGYGRYMTLKTLAVYGGVDIRGQIKKLNRGVDIMVATPGRLMDLMQRNCVKLGNIKVLVIDEADRMFDMGFINDVRRIVKGIPVKRQTLLFSATMSDEVKALTKGIQNEPVMIQIGKQRNPAETVAQKIYAVAKGQKAEMLLFLLKNVHMYSVLVFSRTKHGADKICRKLDKAKILAVAIHSDRTQNQRQRALEGFRAGKYQVMVATDIAARGIDVSGISHVINYDVPTYAEDYIHRIGRTGRAEATGDAITFVSGDEMKYLSRIERYIGRKLKPEKCEGFDYAAVQEITEKTEKADGSREHQKKTFKKKNIKNNGRKKTKRNFNKNGKTKTADSAGNKKKFFAKKTSKKKRTKKDY